MKPLLIDVSLVLVAAGIGAAIVALAAEPLICYFAPTLGKPESFDGIIFIFGTVVLTVLGAIIGAVAGGIVVGLRRANRR